MAFLKTFFVLLALLYYAESTNLACPPNQEYVQCKNPCPDTCETYFSQFPRPICDPIFPCPGGCQCISGYVLNANGECVKPENCPGVPCCKENEVLNLCPGYCTFDNDCASLIQGIIRECAAPPEFWGCSPRCDCKPGLVRIGTECLPPNYCCNNPLTEEIVDCPQPCDNTCTGPPPSDCVRQPCFFKTCHCISPNVRNATGACVPPTECTNQCGKHEIINPCPRYCSFDEDCGSYMYGFIRDCPPPPWFFQCTTRCECKPGYIRVDGKCRTPNYCCGDPKNEVVVNCPHACEETCAGPSAKDCLIDPCFRRTCVCKAPKVRNADGDCVSKYHCGCCKDPNEVYKTCGTACQPTCSNRNPVCTQQCVTGCFCRKGYIRAANGTCIPIEKCPLICGENEILEECPQYCTFDDTCDSLINGIIPDCAPPPDDYQCQQRCSCKEGYVRINGQCVLPNQCCKNPSLEEVVNCPRACEETCHGPPHPDCQITPCVFKTCVCIAPNVRNDNGDCISKNSC